MLSLRFVVLEPVDKTVAAVLFTKQFSTFSTEGLLEDKQM